ncbi:MAG: efflux RND transporter periplasmic adaptor subunit [Deltaproteobacteria bacterium]|nr:efflux RND transporter periplasmic adaptor subunit [Deltaproteobacteria bacterium]
MISVRPKTRKLSRFLIQLMCLLLLTVLTGCEEEQAVVESVKQKEPAPPMEVEAIHLQKGEIWRSVTLPGFGIAYYNTVIYAKIAGYLKYINVDKGDFVKEGEVLAEIENPELEAERPKYEAEVEVWGTQYKRLSEARKSASDLVVPLTVDEMRGKYLVAKANLERIKYLLAYAKVVAPFTGHITARWVDPGAFIPDATSGSVARSTAIVTLNDFSRIRVDVAVPEVDVPFVTTKVPVTVTADALPGKVYRGTVTRFEYALNQSTKTMITEIEVPNPKEELRPGMYLMVKLDLEKKTDALLVPVSAVISEKSRHFVFMIEDDKARLMPVKIGLNDGTNMEILAGMNPNTLVIIPGKVPPKDGQPVTVKGAK